MAQRKKAAPVVVDEAAVLDRVRAELAREGVVKLSSIKPAALRPVLTAKLQAEGVEVTKSVLRRPLLTQLRDALGHGALVPVKSLASHVRGAGGPELKSLVDAAVRDGVAWRVQRGAVEVLARADVRVLSADEVRALRERLMALSKSLEKVTKNVGLMFLASDASEALAEAMTLLEARREKKESPRLAPHEDAMGALLEAVDSVRDVRTGLSFVPAVVGRLVPGLSTSAVWKLLLSAGERELLELRPEGGIGRLSPAELSVCPPGPHGTHLSWARRLPAGAT
jgi:hypothetical protein